nr:DUF5392 family protein [Bacillus licheniformis]
MDMERFHQMPAFMKEEMDNLKRVAAPFLKKRLIFLFIAIPAASCFICLSFLFLGAGDLWNRFNDKNRPRPPQVRHSVWRCSESRHTKKEMFSNR